MDGARFDAWTRRHFGILAGSLTASLAGLASLTDADAKKKRKKKKKKCKKLGNGCQQNNKKKKCCKKLTCGVPFSQEDKHCCRAGENVPCTAETADECCTEICNTMTGFCFCKSTMQICTDSSQCCSRQCTAGSCE